MTVPFGVVLCEAPAAGFADLGRTATAVEEAGADVIWLTDHLYWHRPTVDVITGLQTVAASTQHCQLGPLVLQLPLRDATSTAKSLSYLDHVTGGRVIAGVGVGEHLAEYEAAGKADRYHRRGHLLDEGIDQMRASWSASAAGASGASFVLGPGGPVPIWVGGRSDAARRRAARTGDGWIPQFAPPGWYREQMALLDEDLEAAGRPASAVARSVGIATFVDEAEPGTDPQAWLGRLYGLDPHVFHRMLVRGSAAQVADHMGRLAEAGAERITLMVAGDQPADHLAALIAAAA